MSVSRVVSVRLKDEQSAQLERQAGLSQRTVGETASLLLAEKLREVEFPVIEFRQTASGRLAYVRGTRVAVWLFLMVARDYELDVPRIAEHFGWSEARVQAALDYATTYAGESEPFITEATAMSPERFARRYPQLGASHKRGAQPRQPTVP